MSRVPPALCPDSSVLMVVDLQDRLLPAIHEADQCVAASCRMIEAAKILNVPMLCTEQYPAGIGHTCKAIRDALDDLHVFEKTRFSACIESVTAQLRELDRPNIVVVGIEAHVCVQQTVLDLLRQGFLPFVCVDAISSRRPLDRDTAIERMRQAGAIMTTTESIIFELTGEAATETFKKVLKIVK
jgi:nicotinamidase-related amidase